MLSLIQKIKNNNGLTLVEVLVTAGIFLIILTFATEMYVSLSRLNKTNFSAQKIYSESRYLIDFIAEAIQSGSIDYQTGYPDSLPETELQIKTKDGEKQVYRADGGVLKQKVGSNPEEIELSSSDVMTINKLNFYVYPTIDAFTTSSVPIVTIVWQAKEVNTPDPITVNLQTTVSMRSY
jgi:prepilin-type N-terminal cleavage/methylation domain-containing protein